TDRTQIPLSSVSEVEEGDWICLYNPTDGSWINDPSRPTYREGEWFKVGHIDGNTLIPTAPLWHLYAAADMDIYRLRGPQVQARNFRVKPPYIETASFLVDCSINPIVENVRA